MSIDAKIAQVCQSIPGLTYHYNDWTRANVDMESLTFPVLINLLPADGNFMIKNGQVRDQPNCMFGFLDLTDYDANAPQTQTIVERMKQYALEFVRAVNKSGIFEPIDGTIKYQTIYDKLDINVTGVMLEVTLKERTGACY